MAVSDTAITIAPEVQQFVGETRKMLIDGKWVEAASGKIFPVYNPATGEVMVNVAEGDLERCGSIVTTSSTRPCPLADTNSPAGGVRWATRCWRTTPRSKSVCIGL